MHAIDRRSGEKLWTHSSRTRFDASPVVVGDRVFIGDKSGQLVALALGDGSVSWQTTATDAFLASPAVAGEYLVIPSGDGVVYAFGPKTATAD